LRNKYAVGKNEFGIPEDQILNHVFLCRVCNAKKEKASLVKNTARINTAPQHVSFSASFSASSSDGEFEEGEVEPGELYATPTLPHPAAEGVMSMSTHTATSTSAAAVSSKNDNYKSVVTMAGSKKARDSIWCNLQGICCNYSYYENHYYCYFFFLKGGRGIKTKM